MKICKEIWTEHVLHAYCGVFENTTPSDLTSTSDDMVTCPECKLILETEQSIVKEYSEAGVL